MREKILVSACLLGAPCRYDGESRPLPEETLRALRERFELVAVCPELLGGLAVPRPPAERRGDRVVTKDGRDVTAAYAAGAEAALRLARENGCRLALLKERSPSCGAGRIHDGLFSGGMTSGDGVAAALLKRSGVRVVGESAVPALLEGNFR
jgi:uncharacterized protein YbbK (DUF523 family)